MAAMPGTVRLRAVAAYPWGRAAVAFAVGASLYLLLPEVAPAAVEGQLGVLLFGILLGLAVGLGIRVGPRIAPAVAAGATVGVSLQLLDDGLPTAVSLGLGPVVGLEILLLTYLLRLNGAHQLRRPGDVFFLLCYGLLVAAASGLVAGLIAGNRLPVEDTMHSVRAWSIDDLFGLIVVAPAVMTIHRPSRWSWPRALEFVVVLAVSLALTYYVFRVVEPGDQGLLGWPYLIVLGPLWLAVRLGVAAVTPVSAVVFWLAAVWTADGYGAFAGAAPDQLDRLVALQVFAIVMAATVLILAVLRDDRLRSLDRLSRSSRLLGDVIDGSDALIFAKSYASDVAPRGRYEVVNGAWTQAQGVSRREAIGQADERFFPPEVAAGFVAVDEEVIRRRAGITVEDTIVDRGGQVHHFSTAKFPLSDADGRIWGVGGISTDVTGVMQARDRERRSAELLRAVFEQSPTPAVRLAIDRGSRMRVFDANAAMCTLMGVPRGLVEKCDLLEHIHPEDIATAWDVLTFALSPERPADTTAVRQRELRMRTEDGRTVWVLMSAAAVGDAGIEGETELVAQFEDFTARREAEEALSDQALRDVVTGLPNRRALHERMQLALQRIRRHPGSVTVLFCDLDRFKDVNDSLGHKVGDELLVEVADRLRSVLRPEDTVARLGGDEFVALGEGFTGTSDAILMAVRLQDRLSAPWVFGAQIFRPTMSIGIATTSDPDTTVDELLRRADLAMYRAKEGGRNRVEVYTRSVDEEIQQGVAVQHDLRLAIDTDGLVLHYQPIVRLSDLAVTGAEALVRMRARDGVLIAPGLFVPQAEATGLVVPMGAWVIRRALADLRAWREVGRELVVSVNVSPSQLRDEGFASFLLDEADRAGIDPTWLSVEVTETALIHDPGRSGRELNALSGAGVGVALDDFGTGYSSLAWLTQFPVNVVKIDKSFTDEVGVDPRKTAIVSALIQVSHELGFIVVAEGIETKQQHERLIELGADRGQGYLFGRPVPTTDPMWAWPATDATGSHPSS
jgi:diguanylate cyclase (GGDEF)-like protein/PAS domain S-box-containing protein